MNRKNYLRKIPSLLLSILTLFSCISVNADYRDCVRVPVLMYHSVGYSEDAYTVSPEMFEKQILAVINSGYTPVSFDELINYVDNDANLPENPMCITFDDGYLNNYENAFPILKKYNCKATIFIIGSSVGKSTYKDTQNSISPHFDYNAARDMNLSGLVSIQSHTYDMHQWAPYETGRYVRSDVLRLSGEDFFEYVKAFTNDFLKSRSEIEGQIGSKVNVMAYPGGKYNSLTETILRSMGVRVTVSTTIGANYIKKYDRDSLYMLNRYNMNEEVTPEILAEWLNRR